jgi:glycosyltransferase involved in cell wall biosynthesis
MRIAIVLTGLGAGGAEKVVAALAARRVAAGDEVTLLCMAAPTRESYFALPPAVRVESCEARPAAPGRDLGRTARRLLWLRRRFAALRPDLAISFLTKNNVLSLIASAGLGVPVLASERNNPEIQRNSRFWRRADRALAPRAAGLVLLTEAARDALPPALRRKAVVIPNPVAPPDGFVARPGDGGRVVAVGRLDWQKGFDLLIDAFAAAAPRLPGATLTIWGEGPERPALERRVAALGLGDLVRLPGITARPGAWVEEADLFVLSSRHEGFANALAEAAGAGIPCVSFDCRFGPRDILDDGRGGLLVPPEDVAALAAAIERALGDPALRRRLAGGAPAARERFAPARIAALWDASIAACAAPAAAGRADAAPRAG